MQISFVVLIATLVATVHGLATSAHHLRSTSRHANIAKARSPAPEASAPSEFVSRRGLKKRCKARVQQGGLSEGVGNAASDPADGGVSASQPASPAPSSSPAPAPKPPKTTTSKAADPTTTSQPKPKPTSTESQPAPQPTSEVDGGSHVGQATFYNTGLTACGVTNNDGQNIVAVSQLLFDSFPGYNGVNPNTNPICGKKIRAYFQGRSIEVTVTDRCTGCKIDDLDFTPSAFVSLIGDLGIGRASGMSWDFI